MDQWIEFKSDIGAVAIAWGPTGFLTRIHLQPTLPSATESKAVPLAQPPHHILLIADRLRRYLDSGQPLGRIPWEHIDQSSWTLFQAQVYHEIANIPFAETRTYGWVAARVGKNNATRAVGQALRNNPLPLLVPCHRVVSANSIGGFMGMNDPATPELDLKRKLQSLEQDYLNPCFSFMGGLPASPCLSSACDLSSSVDSRGVAV